MLILRFLKKFAKAENKPSSVPFDPAKDGTQGDDHQSGMPIARHLKRPTRKLSFAFGSGQVLRLRFRTSPSPSVQDKAGSLSFLIRSCSQVGFAQSGVTIGPGGLLHHLFTLTLRSRQRQDSGRSFFCGTFRSLRTLGLRGTLPWRARTFLPDLCWDRGLTPVPASAEAIIYSALANLTHFFDLFLKLTNSLKIIRFLTSKL